MKKLMLQVAFFTWGLFMLASCGQPDMDTGMEPEPADTETKGLWQQQDSTAILLAIRQQLDSLDETAREGVFLIDEINNESASSLKSAVEYTYDIIIMGDCELNFRDITYNELYSKIGKIAGIGTTYKNLRYDDGTRIGKPELAVMAGDLTTDRASLADWRQVERILNQLNNKGIFVFANVGNHDWEPLVWNDGSYGYTWLGHLSNIRSINGVLNIYNTAMKAARKKGASAYFRNVDYPVYVSRSSINWWQRRINLVTAAPVYGFTYKNVDYVVGPRFLFDPKGSVTLDSFFGRGAANFSNGVGKSYLDKRSAKVKTPKRIYIQHYPYDCSDGRWTDYSGRSASQLRSSFQSAMESASVSAMFSGHVHHSKQKDLGAFTDYTSGYTGNAGGPAYFLIARVSSTKGVIQVKEFNTNSF